MKKIFNFLLTILFINSFCFAQDKIDFEKISKIDVKKTCDTKINKIDEVLKKAKLYNKMAKKEHLEFMRLGMSTSQYIKAVQKALDTKSKKIDIINKKKKKTGEMSIEFGATRACTFAIRALQQKHEAQKSWRLAVPGDGFKY